MRKKDQGYTMDFQKKLFIQTHVNTEGDCLVYAVNQLP
jgi:hypothetical protein